MEDSRENSKYFEGVLQLRDCTMEALEFVKKTIDSEDGVWVAKEVHLKGGVDLYMSSNKFLKKIGKMLSHRFSGVLRHSSKLFTRNRQTFKDVYRGTVLFRMPSFRAGDTGVFNGDEVKVLSVGEHVMLQDKKTGRKKRYRFDDVNKIIRLD